MEIQEIELKLPSSEQLLEETAEGIAVMQLAAETFRTGKPLFADDIAEHALPYRNPDNNGLYTVFEQMRRYAFEDIPCYIGNEDMYHAFAFVTSVWAPADFFGSVIPFGCNAVLQTTFARDKLNAERAGFEAVINRDNHLIDYFEYLPYGDERTLTVPEMAALTGLAVQSLRNALHSDKSIDRSIGKQTRQIEVPAAIARRWLKGKGYFREYAPPTAAGELSVPKAGDGTFFDASCKRTKGYTVGKKGEEQTYANFSDALQALEAMPIPYWRRPSKTTGVHGIVKGVEWVSKSKQDLGLK